MTQIHADRVDHSDLEALSVLVNYRRWIIDSFMPYLGGHAVEYGAGIGSIGKEILPHVAALDLVEPIESLYIRLRERFGDMPKVKLKNETIEGSLATCPDSNYDGIVMVNVLEHIADDGAALTGLYRVLKHNGHLCIFVPAHNLLFSNYDRLVGHHRRYSLSTLKSRMLGAGFEICHATYFDVIGVVPWLISMRLLRQTRIQSGFASIYDRWIVPLGRSMESVISPPFGKNVLLVARKP